MKRILRLCCISAPAETADNSRSGDDVANNPSEEGRRHGAADFASKYAIGRLQPPDLPSVAEGAARPTVPSILPLPFDHRLPYHGGTDECRPEEEPAAAVHNNRHSLELSHLDSADTAPRHTRQTRQTAVSTSSDCTFPQLLDSSASGQDHVGAVAQCRQPAVHPAAAGNDQRLQIRAPAAAASSPPLLAAAARPPPHRGSSSGASWMQAAGLFMRSVSVVSASGTEPADAGPGGGQNKIEEEGQFSRQSTDSSHVNTNRWSRLSQGGTPPPFSRTATTVSDSLSRGEEVPGCGAEGAGAPSRRQVMQRRLKQREDLRRCLSPGGTFGSAPSPTGMGRRSNSSASICSSQGANFSASSTSLRPMRSLMIDSPQVRGYYAHSGSGSSLSLQQQAADGDGMGKSVGSRLESLIASAEARQRSAEAAAALRGFRV